MDGPLHKFLILDDIKMHFYILVNFRFCETKIFKTSKFAEFKHIMCIQTPISNRILKCEGYNTGNNTILFKNNTILFH